MIKLIPFDSLGHADHGWLDTRHHFSFDTYHDPDRVHWGALRVWNDDVIAPGTGFGRHPHRDMEIITYVLDGAISHRDSEGNEGRTVAGDVQVMSAGTGILHEEWNRETVRTHIFQIWVIPAHAGGPPRWDAAKFPKADRAGELVALASGRAQDKGSGALEIRQDAAILGATLTPGQSIRHALGPGRLAYVVAARGDISVGGTPVAERSGAAIADLADIEITSKGGAEVLIADVPPLAA
jgi:redox-sensitive bicupin YhaK (pirin superfamily)